MASAPGYKKYDYNAAYQQAEEEQRKAQDAAYNSAVEELKAQSDKLTGQYDAARQGVYKNALISAQGANEVMAANGLTSSGISETSNIRRQIALQSALNQANLQEQEQKDEIARKIIQAGYTRDQNMAQYLAQAIIDRANSEAQENQYAASYDFNAWQAQKDAEQYAQEFAYNKAMNEVNTFGRIITKEAADALVFPSGRHLTPCNRPRLQKRGAAEAVEAATETEAAKSIMKRWHERCRSSEITGLQTHLMPRPSSMP